LLVRSRRSAAQPERCLAAGDEFADHNHSLTANIDNHIRSRSGAMSQGFHDRGRTPTERWSCVPSSSWSALDGNVFVLTIDDSRVDTRSVALRREYDSRH
jgi:hypothetical protein